MYQYLWQLNIKKKKKKDRGRLNGREMYCLVYSRLSPSWYFCGWFSVAYGHFKHLLAWMFSSTQTIRYSCGISVLSP